MIRNKCNKFFLLVLLFALFLCSDKIYSAKKLYKIRNPYTGNYMIIDGEGNKILRTIIPDNEFIDELKDVKGDTKYLYKTIYGEKIEEDGEDNFLLSQKVIFYDLEGKEIGLSGYECSPYMSVGDKILYYDTSLNYDENSLMIYDVKSREKKQAPHKYVKYFGGNLLFYPDDTRVDENEKQLYICDDNIYLVKVMFDIVSFNVAKLGDEEVGIVKYKSDSSDKEKCNFIDKEYKLYLEEPVDYQYIQDSDSSIVTLHRNDIEFDYDFKNRLKIGEDRKYVKQISDYEKKQKKYEEQIKKIKSKRSGYYNISCAEYGDKVLFFANYSSENQKENEMYKVASDIYDININLVLQTEDFNNFYESEGLFCINKDTIYDFDLNIIKKLDEKTFVSKIEKFDKTFFLNNADERYRTKDIYNVYDSKFNIIFENVNASDFYTFDDYVVIEKNGETLIYDKDFSIKKTFDRKLSFYGDNVKYFSFLDKTTNRYGIIDDTFNIIVDNLKRIEFLKEDYFTYMNGFKYGLMDYKGNVLYSFSIFDSMAEDANIDDYKGKYVYEF